MRPCCSQTSRSNRCACGCVGGERGIRAGERRAASDGERVVGIEGEHGDEPRARAFRHAEPRAQARAALQFAPPSRAQTPPPATPALPPTGGWWRWPAGQMEWRRSWRWKKLGDRRRPGVAQHRRGEEAEPQGQHQQHQRRQRSRRRFRRSACRSPAPPVRGRPSTMPKTTRVSPKNASSRQPRNIAVAAAVPGRERGAHDLQFAEERAERRTGRDREHAGDKDRRRARREHATCRARRPSKREPAARRMLPALRNSAPLVRPLLHT